jgi:hypothetical protein
MSSRKQDMLGRLIDTAMQRADDDPGFDEFGYPNVVSPGDEDISESTEDDPAFRGMRESGASPEEAQAAVDYMRPLSPGEREILEDIPELEGMYKVDDAEHQQWLLKIASKKYKGMDRVKDDAIYGERSMNNDEERMEREDSDSGWGFHSLTHGLRKGLGKGLHAAERVAKAPLGLLAHFVPGRDARKAALVRNTYTKLWYEHANWLALQDKNAGQPLQPRAAYEQAAKVWALAQLKQNKLPTNMIPLAERPTPASVSGSDPDHARRAAILRTAVVGSDSMGSWWWPFGQFLSFAHTTINQTAPQRADSPPDGQDATAPSYQDVSSVSAPQQDMGPSPSAPQQDMGPSPDDGSQGEHRMIGWNGFIKTRGLDGVLGGEDSLGAYATQILGAETAAGPQSRPQPAKDNPHVDEIVDKMIFKLKNSMSIDAGEIGLLNSAAKEGNVKAQRLLKALSEKGAVVPGSVSGLDPWLYKLSPGYWFRSSTSKAMKDAEEKKWVENAALQKQLEKQKEDLHAAEQAAQADAAVEQAKQQSADTERQLKEIQASLKGTMSGSFIGHEKITPISQVVVDALNKTGLKAEAAKLHSKIKAGQALSPDELKSAGRIAKIIGRMKVVHGDLVDEQNEALTMHGDFVGACVMGGIDKAIEQNAKYQYLLAGMEKKVSAKQPLTQGERNQLAGVLKGEKTLNAFTKSLVSGRAFVGCKQSRDWSAGAFVGAARALDEDDKRNLAAIVKLAKVGNPRAQRLLAYLKKTGQIASTSMGRSRPGPDSSGGDNVGWLASALKWTSSPLWMPAYGAYKGAQWTSKQLFGTGKGGGSAEQQRLAMMRAAYKRRQAAEARAAAADAQSEAEQRAQAAIADAADAEADAADAQALAKEEAMKTKEVEADPGSLARDDGPDDQSGWKSFVEAGDAAIVAKAAEKSPTGDKLRASKTLLTQALNRNTPEGEKAYQSIAAINRQAKAGNRQAKLDRTALLAARKALLAEKKAKRKQQTAAIKAQRKKAALARNEAIKKKALAMRKAFEANAGDKLARVERKSRLSKQFKAERMAAQGHPRAKAYQAKQVALAKQGDKKALANVQAMQLGRQVRLMTKTKSERRAMAQAMKFVAQLRKNNPQALRDFKVLQDARAHGNPVATRALDRIQLAMMTDDTVRTGVVATGKSKIKVGPVTLLAKSKWQQQQALLSKKQKSKAAVASAQKKAANGTGSREELAHGANEAHKLGDDKTAIALATEAQKAPSATAAVQKQAAKVLASDTGHPGAQAELKETVEKAKTGDPAGIQDLGTTMAARTVDDVNKGKPVSQTMRDAINMHEQIKAGDPDAIAKADQITAAATAPNPAPEATLAAGALVGAKVLDQSLATRPQAKAELMDKVNEPIPAAEKSAAHAEVAAAVAAANAGTITAEQAREASNLAIRLNMPKQASEIIALAPPWDPDPLSSLPDEPLSPIRGAWDLVKASLQALTLTTRDPLANYRGGIANRGKIPVANPPVASIGWSPFNAFKGSLPTLALASMPAMAAAQVASLFKKPGTQHVVVTTEQPKVAKGAPAPAPAVPAAPAAPAAPAVSPEAATAAAVAATSSGKDEIMGSDDYKSLIVQALKAKKMSKDDFNKAVKANLPANADDDTKKASARQTLEFLQSKKVVVGGWHGSFDPDPITVEHEKQRDLVVKAGKATRADLLRLAAIYTFDKGQLEHEADREAKYLTSKGVKISGASIGADKTFKEYVVEAVKAKKISKDDFNKAIDVHCGAKADKEAKKVAAAKVLEFLKSKGVAVG